ncbi:MAG TPA: SDR family oxidoreductase [Pseudonocardia sp.]|nr:SDR family oxidoreductase [Pseudonocardia sp.]
MSEERGSGRLTDLVAVVTGASSGIGRATTRALAEVGARVLAVGRRPDALDETAGGMPSIVAFAADLVDTGAATAVVDAAVARWGRIDVLVNNAGVFTAMPLADVTAERIEALFATNVTAPSLLAGAALPMLREHRGTIINVSSTFGHRPIAGAAHYAASKAAIEQLTRSWALELAADGIRVNAIAPGPTESGALASAGLPAAVIEKIKQDESRQVPLGRRGEPGEVAAWVVHLADPDAAWVTGQVIAVDGGLGLT